MLSANNAGLLIQPAEESIIVTHTADGDKYFLGFMGTGSYSGTFKLYVTLPGQTEVCYYVYYTSPSNRTAYVVDRVEKFPAGTIIELRVVHDSAGAETFYGTLLGGAN